MSKYPPTVQMTEEEIKLWCDPHFLEQILIMQQTDSQSYMFVDDDSEYIPANNQEFADSNKKAMLLFNE